MPPLTLPSLLFKYYHFKRSKFIIGFLILMSTLKLIRNVAKKGLCQYCNISRWFGEPHEDCPSVYPQGGPPKGKAEGRRENSWLQRFGDARVSRFSTQNYPVLLVIPNHHKDIYIHTHTT